MRARSAILLPRALLIISKYPECFIVLASAYTAIALPEDSPLKRPIDLALINITAALGGDWWKSAILANKASQNDPADAGIQLKLCNVNGVIGVHLPAISIHCHLMAPITSSKVEVQDVGA